MQNLVDFEKILTEELKNPDARRMYEVEAKKTQLELKINDVLRDTGNGEYCVSLVELENY